MDFERVGIIARARDLALADALWRRWSPNLTFDPNVKAELHRNRADGSRHPSSPPRRTRRG